MWQEPHLARQKKICALCSALCFTCTHSWTYSSTTTNLYSHDAPETAAPSDAPSQHATALMIYLQLVQGSRLVHWASMG